MERPHEQPSGSDDGERTVEQREAGLRVDRGDEAPRRDEQREQAEEGVLRDSDQGPGGQVG